MFPLSSLPSPFLSLLSAAPLYSGPLSSAETLLLSPLVALIRSPIPSPLTLLTLLSSLHRSPLEENNGRGIETWAERRGENACVHKKHACTAGMLL